MESFRDLQEKHQKTAVKLNHDGITATGVLSLSGQRTSAVLSGENLLTLSHRMRKGFDLPLTVSDGGRILLHNALTTSLRMPTQNTPDYECDIFPNFIAFGAESLTKDGRLKEITFTTKKLGDFFHYEAIEWQSLHKAPQETRQA